MNRLIYNLEYSKGWNKKMSQEKKVYAVILAGGSGERFGGPLPKQFLKLAGKMVIEHTIDVFENHPLIDEIYIVVNSEYTYIIEELINKSNYKKVSKIIQGGNTRQESTKAGVFAIPEENGLVLIHDAVRPFISYQIINQVIEKLSKYEAVDVAVPSPDTIVIRNDDNEVIEIPDRNRLMLGQTPQGFHISVIKQAYKLYEKKPILATDDCKLILAYSLGNIGIVFGERFNIKITYPEDVYLADKIFQVRSKSVQNLDIEISNIKDKVIVVFGGNRGIGKAICEISEKFGAKVFPVSRRNGIDIKNVESVKNALKNAKEKFGKIDFVVNTAALLKMGALKARDYDSIFEEIMTNYYGSVIVAKESFEYLVETHGSLLFFTSSSYTRGRALYSIYSSTKAAIVNLVQALADEWRDFGVRINAINPERTNTEMRRKNFGFEDPSTLLSVETVANAAINVLLSNFTGQVFDIRKENLWNIWALITLQRWRKEIKDREVQSSIPFYNYNFYTWNNGKGGPDKW